MILQPCKNETTRYNSSADCYRFRGCHRNAASVGLTLL